MDQKKLWSFLHLTLLFISLLFPFQLHSLLFFLAISSLYPFQTCCCCRVTVAVYSSTRGSANLVSSATLILFYVKNYHLQSTITIIEERNIPIQVMGNVIRVQIDPIVDCSQNWDLEIYEFNSHTSMNVRRCVCGSARMCIGMYICMCVCIYLYVCQ